MTEAAKAPVSVVSVPFRDTHLVGHCSMGAWLPRKADMALSASTTAGAGADSGRIRVWKSLFGKDSKIHEVVALHQNLGNYIRELSSPWGSGGDRLIPADHIDGIDAEVDKTNAAMGVLVTGIVDNWDALVVAERDRLKGAYDPTDYPSQSEIRGKYYIRWDYWMVPSDSSSVFGQGLTAYADRLRENEAARMEYQKKVIQRDMAAKLAEPLANVVKLLRKDKTKLHRSLLGNITQILCVASAMNVYNDSWINRLTAELHELTRNDVQVLREDKSRRNAVADKAADIIERYL